MNLIYKSETHIMITLIWKECGIRYYVTTCKKPGALSLTDGAVRSGVQVQLWWTLTGKFALLAKSKSSWQCWPLREQRVQNGGNYCNLLAMLHHPHSFKPARSINWSTWEEWVADRYETGVDVQIAHHVSISHKWFSIAFPLSLGICKRLIEITIQTSDLKLAIKNVVPTVVCSLFVCSCVIKVIQKTLRIPRTNQRYIIQI